MLKCELKRVLIIFLSQIYNNYKLRTNTYIHVDAYETGCPIFLYIQVITGYDRARVFRHPVELSCIRSVVIFFYLLLLSTNSFFLKSSLIIWLLFATKKYYMKKTGQQIIIRCIFHHYAHMHTILYLAFFFSLYF